MAKFEEWFLTGKVKWVKTKSLSKYGNWGVVLYPDTPSLEKIKQLKEQGIKNELKKDDDGYFMSFSRPPEKKDRQGRRFALNPVVVIDKDGRLFEDHVGNGSDCTLKLEVYGGKAPTGQDYRAARLAGIKILNLVPYNPETDTDNKFELRAVSGLKEQPLPKDHWV